MKRSAISFLVLVCFAGTLGLGQSDNSTSDLPSLINTERAFARACGEKGIRASFLQFFAENGIAFFPRPVKFKEAVKDRPAQAHPLAVLLEWEPRVAGIAASGDMGYTTGPSIWTDDSTKEKRYGQFFSIWKKQQDGAWKVAVDIGIETPTAAPPLGLPCEEISDEAGCSATVASGSGTRERFLYGLESDFGMSCLTDGTVQAYLSRADDFTRLHREKLMPVVGVDAIKNCLATESRVAGWSPMGSDVSAAGDLGYTYGSYELTLPRDSKPAEKGYYLHVWKCTGHGEWKLVVDVAKPEPPTAEK